jgi:hypothetical protein
MDKVIPLRNGLATSCEPTNKKHEAIPSDTETT